MQSDQTFITLLRQMQEDRTALLMRALEKSVEINQLMEERLRQQRQEQRQSKGR